jgi:hypothetical protein
MGLIDDKKRVNEIEALEERAILVGLITPQQGEAKAKEYLDELEFLAETAGAVTVRTFLQRCDGPNSTSYVGKGKLEEIVAFVQRSYGDRPAIQSASYGEWYVDNCRSAALGATAPLEVQ